MLQKVDIPETILMGLGFTLSIEQIESILGIILLVFNIIWLIAKFIYRLIKHIKNKDYQSAIDDIEDLTEEIESLKGGDNIVK